MILRPPTPTRTVPLFPYTTLVRSVAPMSKTGVAGRLSVPAAACVVARRDFVAILFSRTFFFFLLGPLFPVIVGVLAGSVGNRVDQTADRKSTRLNSSH